MTMAHYQVRSFDCFDEKTVADLYGLDHVRLGVSPKSERLMIALSGTQEMVWSMSETGELTAWDGEGVLLLPVAIQIPPVRYAEVLEPVTFAEGQMTTILEVFSATQSLAIRGHWQDGRLYEAVVTLEQPMKLVNLGFWSRVQLDIDTDNSSKRSGNAKS